MDSEEFRALKESLDQEKRFRLEAEESLKNEKRLRQNEKILRQNEQRLRSEAERMLNNETELRMKAESALNIMKFSAYKSTSYAQVYGSFLNKGILTKGENLELPNVSPDQISIAWDRVISEITILQEGKDEKFQVHPFIEMALGTIIDSLDLGKIKIHHEAHLQNPCFRPDFTVSSSQIQEPAWQDCLSFIECKSSEISSSEGGGQAVSYLTHLLFPPDRVDLELMPKMTFTAQTNGQSIQFFIFKKTGVSEVQTYYTSLLELVNSSTSTVRGAPSDGFVLLCRFMKFLGDSSISGDSVRINGIRYDILKTFQKNESMVVGLIDLGDEEGQCVAKYAINQNKQAMFLIRKEALAYELLKEKDSPVKTLTPSKKSNSNNLIFREVASGDLKSWCYQILYSDSNEDSVSDVSDSNEDFDSESKMKFYRIVNCFIEIFDQVKALHDYGYTHSDIRPANILILNDDTPRLIDFVTLTKHGEILIWLQGTLLFMAEEILCLKEKPYVFKRKYDMESLSYSFLDCIDKYYSNSYLRSLIYVEPEGFDPKKQEESFARHRRSHLERLRNEIKGKSKHFPNSMFVTLFFNFFDKLANVNVNDDLNEQDYIELRTILSSFLV